MNRTEAKINGASSYFSDNACSTCGSHERRTSSGNCLPCANESQRKYRKTEAGKRSKKASKIGQKHKARKAIENAIRQGRMVKEPCGSCGVSIGVEAHHEDYGKPFDVMWLCRKHHVERHHFLKTAIENHPTKDQHDE